MNTEEGLFITVIIGLIALLVLSIFLSWYRFRTLSKKAYGKPLSDQPASNSTAERQSSGISEEVLREALSGIQDGILILGNNLQVEFVNSAAERIFGSKAEMVNGSTFIEIVRDYEFDALIKKSVSTGQQQNSLIRNRNRKQLFNVNVVPVQNRFKYVVIVTDMTERQQLEDIRRDFISNISHEFRTPISSIILISETLLGGAMNDPKVARDFLKKIDIETRKLQQMTEELSVLARVESGGSVTDKGITDIQQLIRHSIERLSAMAEKSGVLIDLDLQSVLPSPIIDKDQIESVLVNLIHNAIKFTGRGGRIVIAARKEMDFILVSVSDTGIGIPQEELPRVFERFYKVDKSRAGEGSGLGLAISKHIISAHGGKIWAESTEGKGSTFFFTLPLSAS
ncbi:MAG: ATP-binding protein [Dehalococcoidia bacterium]|jgi:two-component system phosphate regulon sensor histidine kinase PhoR